MSNNPTRMVRVSALENQPGSTAWTLVDKGLARFHRFSTDFEEFDAGPAPHPVAIVEFPDGQVRVVRADRIRFVSPDRHLLALVAHEARAHGIDTRPGPPFPL